jgi:hypothetical protein
MTATHTLCRRELASYIQYTPNQSDLCVLPWIQWIQGWGAFNLMADFLQGGSICKLKFFSQRNLRRIL